MNKWGLMTAGVFMVPNGLMSLIFAGILASRNAIAWSVVGFMGGGCYIASAVCIFVFLCGPRFERCQRLEDSGNNHDVEEGTHESSHTNQVVTETPAIVDLNKEHTEKDESVVSVLDADAMDAKSVHNTIYHLPDGRIKTVTEVILSDGTKHVTTTIEHPLPK
jgi:hypothetical protein